MTGGPQDGRVRQIVAGMVGLEGRTAGLIERLRADSGAHPGAGAAFERFAQTAAAHRERLGQHAQELGLPAGPSGAPGAPGAASGSGADRQASEAEGGVYSGRVSRALRGACLAFNEAVMGYGVLHETAHVCGSQRYPATLRIAEQHLREYAAAAQETAQLLADVVAWELRQEGQFCACECPACGLGVCWCVAHTTDAMATAWRETAPAYPSLGLRVVPGRRRPADLDVREGDLVVAVDGRRVATTADVTAAVLSHAPGEPVTLGIERHPVGALEVTARRTR
jgi:PDZ domain